MGVLTEPGYVILYTSKPGVERMLEVARSTAKELDLRIVDEKSSAGSLEQPRHAKSYLSRDDVLGVAVLGIIRRGETQHGNVIAHAIVPALVQLQLEFMKPVTLGIIGPDVAPEDVTEYRLRYFAEGAIRALIDLPATIPAPNVRDGAEAT